jgi:hypothetical protein
VVKRIGINDIDRVRGVLQVLEVALDDVAILLPRIEIDADREGAEIEKRLHLRADARAEAENVPALPFDVERV